MVVNTHIIMAENQLTGLLLGRRKFTKLVCQRGEVKSVKSLIRISAVMHGKQRPTQFYHGYLSSLAAASA